MNSVSFFLGGEIKKNQIINWALNEMEKNESSKKKTKHGKSSKDYARKIYGNKLKILNCKTEKKKYIQNKGKKKKQKRMDRLLGYLVGVGSFKLKI